jgi:hypothetical protein
MATAICESPDVWGSSRRCYPGLARRRKSCPLTIRRRWRPGIVVGDAPDADGEKLATDLRISGSLPDVIHLASAPLFGGVPKPTHARGRAAISRFAKRSVKIEGSPMLARRLLRLLEIQQGRAAHA